MRKMINSKKVLRISLILVFTFSFLYLFRGNYLESFNREEIHREEYVEESQYGVVERVIDGDTAEIKVNGEVETFRFLGVDTPELHLENDPEDYRGITDEKCLSLWAEKATNYTKDRIEGEEVRLVYDSRRGRKGFYGRTLAYIEINDSDFTKELIDKGYARVYDRSEFIRKLDYLEAESIAYSEQIGLWKCS